MKWSDEKTYNEIYDAIVFDDDEQKALELLKKAIAENTVNVNQTDKEGNPLIQHAEMNCMDEVCSFLIEHGAVNEQ